MENKRETAPFTSEMAQLVLQLYDDYHGNCSAVFRCLQEKGYSLTYRHVYDFLEKENLSACGIARKDSIMRIYSSEIVSAYFQVHGNIPRAQRLLGRAGISISEEPIRLCWQQEGLRPLGRKVSAEIKRMVMKEVILYSDKSYSSVAMMLRTFGINSSSRWQAVYHEMVDSFEMSYLRRFPFRSRVFTDPEFEELSDYFEECGGDPDAAGKDFKIPSSAVLFHWDDAEKPFDFKYVPGVEYRMELAVKKDSLEESMKKIRLALEDTALDTVAAWNILKNDDSSIRIHQVLRMAREMRSRKRK